MIRWLRAIGATHIKTHGSSISSGEPDLIASLPPWGFTLCVEVKKPGGLASPQQVVRARQWRASGAIALICDNLDQLKERVNAAVEYKLERIRDTESDTAGP